MSAFNSFLFKILKFCLCLLFLFPLQLSGGPPCPPPAPWYSPTLQAIQNQIHANEEKNAQRLDNKMFHIKQKKKTIN